MWIYPAVLRPVLLFGLLEILVAHSIQNKPRIIMISSCFIAVHCCKDGVVTVVSMYFRNKIFCIQLLESMLGQLVLYASMSRAPCYENRNVMLRMVVGTSAHQMLILLSLHTISSVCQPLPWFLLKPCPVWCSGWELVFVNNANAGRDPPSQHRHRSDHVWLTVGGKHRCGNTCREKEDRRGPTETLCLVSFSVFLICDGTTEAQLLLTRPKCQLLLLISLIYCLCCLYIALI